MVFYDFMLSCLESCALLPNKRMIKNAYSKKDSYRRSYHDSRWKRQRKHRTIAKYHTCNVLKNGFVLFEVTQDIVHSNMSLLLSFVRCSLATLFLIVARDLFGWRYIYLCQKELFI